MFLFLEEHLVFLLEIAPRVSGSNSLATGFDSDHPDTLIIQKRMEQANGIAAATDASNEQIGQALFAFEDLLSRFLANDALKITHHHRIRMGTEGAANI